MSRDQKRWKEWADQLRQVMMSDRVGKVTKSVAEITQETGTEKSATTLQSPRFWNSCRDAEGSCGALSKAGFDVSFTPNAAGKVEVVTLQLNGNWQAILQRVLDRQK